MSFAFCWCSLCWSDQFLAVSQEVWKMEDLSGLLPVPAEQGLSPAAQDLSSLPGLVEVPVQGLEPPLVLEVQVFLPRPQVQMGL